MIYIATHKTFIPPVIVGYVPLNVGAALRDDLGYLRDDSGDNISDKNPNFCELTGLYWIWKNVKDDYVGLAHYRRFFAKTEMISSYKVVYDFDELLKKLKKADIVLPKKEVYKTTAKKEIISGCTTEEVFNQLRESVKNIQPDYIEEYDRFFANNRGAQYNMLFCKKELFDEYCEWLFSILFDLEKKIDIEKLKGSQKRVYGYLSERLLNIWVEYNSLSVTYVSTVQMEMSFLNKIQLIRRRVTNQIRFLLHL